MLETARGGLWGGGGRRTFKVTQFTQYCEIHVKKSIIAHFPGQNTGLFFLISLAQNMV